MKLLIAGAGGHGRVVAELAGLTGPWTEIAFLDDRNPGEIVAGGWRVVGRLADLESVAGRFHAFVAAFGDAALRIRSHDRAVAVNLQTPVLIHPRATVSSRTSIGPGSVVIAGAVINVGSTLGRCCIVNTAATVDHDCRLADGVHVCPGAHLAGEVEIGQRTWFGIGAVAKQRVRIGSDVTVGAGAVCIADVRDGVTVAGVPAREVKG